MRAARGNTNPKTKLAIRKGIEEETTPEARRLPGHFPLRRLPGAAVDGCGILWPMTSPPRGARQRPHAQSRALAALVGGLGWLLIAAPATADLRRFAVQPEASEVSFTAT